MPRESLYFMSYAEANSDEDIIGFFEKHDSVSDWFVNLPSSIFFKSKLGGDVIGREIITIFPNVRFFLTEVTSNYWGRLPEDHWKRFNSKPKIESSGIMMKAPYKQKEK